MKLVEYYHTTSFTMNQSNRAWTSRWITRDGKGRRGIINSPLVFKRLLTHIYGQILLHMLSIPFIHVGQE